MVIKNVTKVDSTVTLEIFNERGRVTGSGMSGISVAAGKTTVIPLASYVPKTKTFTTQMAALYLLALHRLLRARLGFAYEPERQLGGAVYLFLRGIDGPAQGCCTLPAPLPLLQALDAMLGAEAAA